MSYGTKLGHPLSTPNLISIVLANQDYRNKGYVWGQSGDVNYCFMDPGKVRWDIWEKSFTWWHLAALLPNLLAAIAAVAAQMYGFAAWLFIGLPTLPLALLHHYRSSAKSQVAAVVTNGPQMQYPFGLSTKGIATLSGGIAGVGGVIAGYFLGTTSAVPAAGVTVLQATMPAGLTGSVTLGTVTLSAVFIKFILAIGTAVNVGAFAIFILGTMTKPFDRVISPSIRDIPVPAFTNWHHLGRNGTALGTYRIATGAPLGLRWGCGGLVPILVNHVATRFATSLAASGTFQPNELVIWGVLPLDPDGQPIGEDGFGSELHGSDTDWNEKSWNDLTEEEKALWQQLGWNQALWDGEESPPTESKTWEELSQDERDAATGLGYDEYTWNEIDVTGMLVCVGSENYQPAIARNLRTLGVTQAVACDGHLSPLMGTHGNLLFSTNFALDPIQKYGFMAIPE